MLICTALCQNWCLLQGKIMVGKG